jgi:hypothetical protein
VSECSIMEKAMDLGGAAAAVRITRIAVFVREYMHRARWMSSSRLGNDYPTGRCLVGQ